MTKGIIGLGTLVSRVYNPSVSKVLRNCIKTYVLIFENLGRFLGNFLEINLCYYASLPSLVLSFCVLLFQISRNQAFISIRRVKVVP